MSFVVPPQSTNTTLLRTLIRTELITLKPLYQTPGTAITDIDFGRTMVRKYDIGAGKYVTYYQIIS